LVTRALDVAQDALRALQQPLTAFGQSHTAIGARKQCDIEFVLEPLNMPGKRRLCDVKMCRSAGDAAEFGDADEIVKTAKLHRGRHSAHSPQPASTEFPTARTRYFRPRPQRSGGRRCSARISSPKNLIAR